MIAFEEMPKCESAAVKRRTVSIRQIDMVSMWLSHTIRQHQMCCQLDCGSKVLALCLQAAVYFLWFARFFVDVITILGVNARYEIIQGFRSLSGINECISIITIELGHTSTWELLQCRHRMNRRLRKEIMSSFKYNYWWPHSTVANWSMLLQPTFAVIDAQMTRRHSHVRDDETKQKV